MNHEDGKHVTALNIACDEAHEVCAKLLLQSGAHADVADDWGDTPRAVRAVAKKKERRDSMTCSHS